jgi:hypothetical protein
VPSSADGAIEVDAGSIRDQRIRDLIGEDGPVARPRLIIPALPS